MFPVSLKFLMFRYMRVNNSTGFIFSMKALVDIKPPRTEQVTGIHQESPHNILESPLNYVITENSELL